MNGRTTAMTMMTRIAVLAVLAITFLMFAVIPASTTHAQQNQDIVITKDDLNLPNAQDQIGGDQVTAVLNIAYLVAGFTAVIVIIIGGIRYATSDGDSSGIQAAKNTVMYAVVGLVVVLAAAALTNFVLQNVTKQG